MSYKYLKGVLLLVGLGLGSEVYAACAPIGNFRTQDVRMDLGAVVVKPDSPLNQPLVTKRFPITSNGSEIRCTSGSTDTVIGELSNSPRSLGNNIYSTNIPGIGIRLYREVSSSNNNIQSTYYPHTLSISGGAFGRTYSLAEGYFVVEIIKTAQNTGTGKLVQGKYSSYHLNSLPSNPILTSHVYGDSITITTSSCEISGAKDKVVQLPTVANTGFKGIGTTQGAQPFDINIKCVGGKNLQQPEKISLSFDYDAANGTNNVLKNLAPDNIKAKGVGTQLVVKEPGVNKAIIKQEKVTVGNLNSEQQITYNLPLEARYYQTEATVTAGEVKSMATVTIQYD